MQHALEHDSLRHIGDRVLTSLVVVESAPARPTLGRARNGRGEEYFTLRYWSPGYPQRQGKERILYLGRLAAAEVVLIEQHILDCWGENGTRCDASLLLASIKALREGRNVLLARAQGLARKCGYNFHGYRLRRSQNRPASLNAEGIRSLIDLQYAMAESVKFTLNILNFTRCRLEQLLSRPLSCEATADGSTTLGRTKRTASCERHVYELLQQGAGMLEDQIDEMEGAA